MSNAAASSSFVVTTSAGGTTSSRLWDASAPLEIGKFKWVLERVPGGVRLRGLTKGGAHREIPDAAIAAGAQVPVTLGLSLTIRPVVRMAPVFAPTSRAKIELGSAMSVYSCQGKWVKDSASLADEFVAMSGARKLFAIRQCGRRGVDPYEIESFADGIVGMPVKGTKLTSAELATLSLAFGEHSWKFGAAHAPELPAASPSQDSDNEWFTKKALRGAAIGLGAFILMSLVWPKPQVEELVPEQFAKIVLTAPSAKQTTTTAGSESMPMRTDVAKDAPKAVQNSAVVSAFRAQALQNSVSGLLKGGMTKLLAQSDFVAGKSATGEARRIFDTRSAALGAAGSATGDMSARDVKVAAIGGEGGNGKGAAKGYGKGEHAAVKGQGQSFVSMDIGGAAVAEGLTKDEVGEVIHRHLSEVRYCYESAMLRKPDLEGKLHVNFTIGAPGNVKTTEVRQSTLDEPRLDDCILRRLASWKFPQPRGGIDVAVSYPFIFKTLGR